MATAADVDARLLRAWRAAGDRTLCADDAELTPEVLAERVRGLRGAGYGIDGPLPPGERYRLACAPTRLVADDLCAALPAGVVAGREIFVFEETDSTNDLAAQAGRDGVAEGLVFFAESQRAGRGRLGRRWVSPPGRNLLFSVLLRPASVPAERWSELTFCAALAVAETAERFTGQAARVKWPNDVLLSGRKVAGILLETHHAQEPGFVVVGIGLNVLQSTDDFPPELRERAGSLAMMRPAGVELERREVAAFLLTRLDEHYRQWHRDFAPIHASCLRRHAIIP